MYKFWGKRNITVKHSVLLKAAINQDTTGPRNHNKDRLVTYLLSHVTIHVTTSFIDAMKVWLEALCNFRINTRWRQTGEGEMTPTRDHVTAHVTEGQGAARDLSQPPSVLSVAVTWPSATTLGPAPVSSVPNCHQFFLLSHRHKKQLLSLFEIKVMTISIVRGSYRARKNSKKVVTSGFFLRGFAW